MHKFCYFRSEVDVPWARKHRMRAEDMNAKGKRVKICINISECNHWPGVQYH